MKFAAAKHYAFVFLHIIVFIVVSIVLFVEFFYRAIKYTYGLISIEQIIFHLKNPIDTIDFSTVIPVLPFIFLFVSTVIIYFFFTYYIFIKNDPSKVMKTLAAIMSAIRNIFGNILKLIIKFAPPHICCSKRIATPLYLVLCLIVCGLILKHIDKRFQIIQFFNRPTSDFIEKNYARPEISFHEKKNLVLIFLESMEAGYTKASLFGRNLIPELEELAKNNLSFPGHTQTYASEWTQAAHINMLLGVPLLHIMFNKDNKQKTFLKNACSVTDELFKQGYSICKISGASGKFANENTLYRTHHVDNIYDRDYYDNLGYDRPENKGTGWGYKDEFIYNQAFDEYKKLRTQGNPFCMIIKTVDTHFPYGYVDAKYNVYGDTRDAMIRASIMCRTFVDRIRSFEDDTTIIILGDHLWMDKPTDEFTEFTKKLHPRKIYTCFINTVFPPDAVDTQRAFAPFDMAPTILESIGAHIEGGRFGLGTSLYSKQKTLIEQYGADYINEEFQKEHPFYLTLF